MADRDPSPPKYPGIRINTNGNQLVARHVEAMICDAGVFYPITPSTEMGEIFQLLYAKGQLNAYGESFIAIETEGEHAAQGGAIAISVTGKRVVNFTSGQGLVYGIEQYYHAPGKLSTLVVEVGARALTKHALNVHCGHDDVYSTLDTGWLICFAKDGQQGADQAIILRKVAELSLNPGMNCQDGMLTTHLERTYLIPEPELIREYLGRADDEIACPTEAQQKLFGPTRRRVPAMIDLERPLLLGTVQNQEHYMNGVAARRNHFSEPILGMFEKAYAEFGELTGRHYGLISCYNCEDAETIFVCLGSAAENVEEAIDYLQQTRSEQVGVIHVNLLRPFPENAIIKALRGKKQVIVLERTDESLSPDNPLTRDIRIALDKAAENFFGNARAGLEKLNPSTEKPEIFSGVYGLGSRDFRPEGILGAYEFALGKIRRQDGLGRDDGVRNFFVGINHPYAVISNDTPSLLPKGSIAVRFHSIGGWGMITTGKNLSGILSAFNEKGLLREEIHINANPKYGSEKKGAPTNYFLVAAPARIRVNCDLQHVDVVLCCDPKAFLHTNPLHGIYPGGAFVWESNREDPKEVWRYIPTRYRKEIIEKKIRVFALNGFDVAREATDRKDLQTRMQGNSFLGAFFKVSGFLDTHGIPEDVFRQVIRDQYDVKFRRFGDEVVESNMRVMIRGFNEVKEVPQGSVYDLDDSSFCGPQILPCGASSAPQKLARGSAAPIFSRELFDAEFRAGLGYNQPASVLSSVGCMAAGTGAEAQKYVARRETPVYIAENCTQCMDCISICPDTAMPNTTQPVETILETAIKHYVSDGRARTALLAEVPELTAYARAQMLELLPQKENPGHFRDIIRQRLRDLVAEHEAISLADVGQLTEILDILPLSYKRTPMAFKSREKKNPGSGGLFGIFINDLCKGCAACVEVCNDDALIMRAEDENEHARYLSSSRFLDLLPDTDPTFLGIYKAMSPTESKAAALRYHLMVQSNYKALVSGDGACAGCGEKSVLHSLATITEALMRPIFQNKAERLNTTAARLRTSGRQRLAMLDDTLPAKAKQLRLEILHLVLGYGRESDEATQAHIAASYKGDDGDMVEALATALARDAANHAKPHLERGRLNNGMSVMAMAAHTGCNTVYGSTPPNNPHPYPWMNSLFQDGATVGWLISESFVQNHIRGSVVPERLAQFLLGDKPMEVHDHFSLSHFDEAFLSDDEALELPKVWVIGGDGGMGDIGFQNVSMAVLQNRPNLKMLMLDTQVYSNTGGQNSGSSPLTGGFDMNSFGPATEGKMVEMKSVSEAFLGGHGSPYIAQVSIANTANLYKSLLDGLCYRGTAYFQVYTTCQPEHGVADDASRLQAVGVRDSRGMPEFTYDPGRGETYSEAMVIKENPNFKGDWYAKPTVKRSREKYLYTAAHWAVTEPRFRNHHQLITAEQANDLISLDKMLLLLTMDDVVKRHHLIPNHRSFIPKNGVYMVSYDEQGEPAYRVVSRQMVIFCVERRKSWRMLQSRAGVANPDYVAQKELLRQIDGNEVTREAFLED